MKWTFEKTANVMRLSEATVALTQRYEKIAGLGAVEGPAGIGKSEAVSWLVGQMDGIYVEMPRRSPSNWLLREILAKLGGGYHRTYEDLFNALVQVLAPPNQTPPIFIDEADNLFRGGTIDILRSLHNRTHVPIIFIGERNFFNRLRHIERIWSRCTMRISFVPLTEEEVGRIAFNWAGLRIEQPACQMLAKCTGADFRDVIAAIYHLEQAAKANKTQTINLQILERVLNNGARKGGCA